MVVALMVATIVLVLRATFLISLLIPLCMVAIAMVVIVSVVVMRAIYLQPRQFVLLILNE